MSLKNRRESFSELLGSIPSMGADQTFSEVCASRWPTGKRENGALFTRFNPLAEGIISALDALILVACA